MGRCQYRVRNCESVKETAVNNSQSIKQLRERILRGGRVGAALALVISLFGGFWSAAVPAQAFPVKPIRLIVPYPPGGATDIVGRTYAQQLSQGLGQQVLVENRPGAGATIGTLAAAKSPGDGYTVLLGTLSNLACAPSLYPNVGYDPIKSFAPVGRLTNSLFVIVVHPALPIKSLRELIGLAKSRPAELTYGSAGSGTLLHIAGEMFKTAAGVNIIHVPYKGGGVAVIDLLAGRIQIIFDQLPTYQPHVQAGKLKVLAVAGPNRLSQLPDVPTTGEAGMPGFQIVSWFGLVAPTGTPNDAIRRLNAEVLKASETKELKDVLSARGADAAGSSPEELAALIADGVSMCSRVIRTAGIKLD